MIASVRMTGQLQPNSLKQSPILCVADVWQSRINCRHFLTHGLNKFMSKQVPAASLTEKKCKRCEELLHIDQFYKQKAYGPSTGKMYDTWDSYCKKCRLINQNERRTEIKRQAIKYLGGKCVECGESRDIPCIYDFHHIDPATKDFTIAKTVKLFEVLKPELDKCILLCANCHRIRHYNPF